MVTLVEPQELEAKMLRHKRFALQAGVVGYLVKVTG
jgi:hypothetical protein